MDELAVVEPHGPDRIVAAPGPTAHGGACRGDGPDARRRQRRARACSSAAAACSPSSRPCRTAPASGCAVGAYRPIVVPFGPDDRLLDLLERDRSPMATQRHVFPCQRHPRGPDRRRRPRADDGLRRARRGWPPRSSPRSRRTPWSRGSNGAGRRPGSVAVARDRRWRSSSRCYVCVPHTMNRGVPTSETFRTYFDDLERHAARACGPPSCPSPRRAARCCSRWSRCGLPARSRSGRRGELRRDARRDRTEPRVVRRDRGAG